jgi:hypothetical protein
MSGWSILVEGRVLDDEQMIDLVLEHYATIAPRDSELLAYVLWHLHIKLYDTGDALVHFLAGFRSVTEAQLRCLKMIDNFDVETPAMHPEAWDPPLVKAAAARALAAAFRAKEPGAIWLWRQTTVDGDPLPEDWMLAEVALGTYHAGVGPDDWSNFLACDLEQFAKTLDLYAAAGETSVCLVLNG